VGLLLPQADRAAYVGADLRVTQDPVDLPVPPGLGDFDAVRVHPDDDDRRLGLGLLELHAVEVGEVGGLGVHQLPHHDLAGLERQVGHVVDQPNSLGPDGLLDRLAADRGGRPGPQVGEGDQSGYQHDPQGAGHSGAQQLSALDAGVLDPQGHLLDQGVADVVGGRGAVAVTDDLDVAHQRPRPVDRGHADQQGGQPGGEPQQHRLQQVAATEHHHDRILGDGEVDHHERDRQNRDQGEHQHDLPVGAVGGGLVDVGEPLDVRLDPGVGDRRAVVGAHARAPRVAIQTANTTRPPIPTTQPQKPSDTGPRPPRVRPPEGCAWTSSR